MAKPTADRPLYRPSNFAMVRSPLLPVEAYESLRCERDQFALLEDPRVRRAVAAGSLSLLNALDRFEQSTLTRKDEERFTAKLLRYQIRMSTRPTPYGLFAGCAIVPIGERTDVTIRATFGASHTRPDMAWLMDFVTETESDPLIRRRLRLMRNPLIRMQGDRISLATRMPTGSENVTPQPVSALATAVVRRALELATSPIEYDTLAERLLATSQSATPEKVDRLLSELCEQTFLLTDLRPPLTTHSPAECVLRRLSDIPEAAVPYKRLQRLMDAIAVWDRTTDAESVPALRALLKEAGRPDDGSKDAPFQVDLALAVNGGLGLLVANEAAKAAEMLLRVSPSPRGISSLVAYRSAFVARYGHEREIPLLELLDPDRGLGAVSAHGHGYVGPDSTRAARRSAALLAWACAALHDRRRVITLDEKALAAIETWESRPDTAPLSLDINLLVVARSADAIDNGDFMAVVGPNLGAWAAGRNFGRFAHLDGPERGRERLRAIASADETDHLQDHLWVEVVFLPSNVRSANVAIRPAIRTHEVVFGVSPGVPASNVIPLDELLVGVNDGRFYVRWPAAGKRLGFVSGHMLNPHGAPPVAQFLLQVSYDGLMPFTSFDWGPAEGFPFLPRVQAGRIVLRPAEWNVAKETIGAGSESVERWRRDWDVPHHIALTVGDNRLIIDLDQPVQARQLLAEAGTLRDGQTLLVQEVLPALDEAWLQGPEGHYYGEFVIPLVRCHSIPKERIEGSPAIVAADGGSAPERKPAVERLDSATSTMTRRHPPGSAWMFVKLYCSSHREDALIGGSLQEFADNVIASELADSWFFIRYGDPEAHLRVRFHGQPERLSNQLFGQVCQWARGLMDTDACSRFAFDTYDQEIERFGGPDGMTVAESLFYADSRSATALVKALRTKEWAAADDRSALLAVAIDDLLDALGFDERQRVDWYRRQIDSSAPDVGQRYRELKTVLRAALGDTSAWLVAKPFGAAIESALGQRRSDVAELARTLRRLSTDRRLSQSPESLGASFTHLQLNRVGAAADERALLGLLHRTRAGLLKAPLMSVR